MQTIASLLYKKVGFKWPVFNLGIAIGKYRVFTVYLYAAFAIRVDPWIEDNVCRLHNDDVSYRAALEGFGIGTYCKADNFPMDKNNLPT